MLFGTQHKLLRTLNYSKNFPALITKIYVLASNLAPLFPTFCYHSNTSLPQGVCVTLRQSRTDRAKNVPGIA